MTSVRIASFNIRHARGLDDRVDLCRIYDVLAPLEPDVVALQEVDQNARRSGRVDQASMLGEQLGMTSVFAPSRGLGWRGRYGLALLARGVIGGVSCELLSRKRWLSEQRIALYATVHVKGLALSVATTHLAVRERESGPQLLEVLSTLGDRPRPRLLVGDLNRKPEDVKGLTSAGYSLGSEAPTFPAAAPRACIDYVAFDTGRMTLAQSIETTASDHCALVVDLAFD